MADRGVRLKPVRRSVNSLRNLHENGKAGSYYMKAGESVRPTQKMYQKSKIIEWFITYAKSIGPNHPFQGTTPTENCVFPLGDNVTVSIAGDWGTGTDEAERVTVAMESFTPEFTIHLGDVYYVGDHDEVNQHCLGKNKEGEDDPICVKWRHGTRGSFALNANHEMYANGKAYFKRWLRELGMFSPTRREQIASFFCLENDHWQVIGIDTGYNSVGVPFLGKVVAKIPWIKKKFKPSCKLEKVLMQWLKAVVALGTGTKGVVILSHHQYYSSFEEGYPEPAKQLSQLISKPVLWFWAHEHRMAGYECMGDGLQAHGRCMGHGGMPIEDVRDKLPVDKDGKCRVLFYDGRKRRDIEDLGYNGFANLRFMNSTLEVDYYDLEKTLLYRERFSRTADGSVVRESGQKMTNASGFLP